MILAIPGLAGLAFAGSYELLLASSLAFGFFLMAGGPIGYQYSAEICYPAPEATSQGLLLLAGQISGIVFVIGMDVLAAGSDSKTLAMIVFLVLMALNVFLTTRLRESTLVKSGGI
ncbi:MAG TPA: hypothetical protein PLL15_10835 [Syntrophales bacterium]|jgi:hypothetical protein|nr:hypothetical protein [Syntrophales bacterium]